MSKCCHLLTQQGSVVSVKHLSHSYKHQKNHFLYSSLGPNSPSLHRRVLSPHYPTVPGQGHRPGVHQLDSFLSLTCSGSGTQQGWDSLKKAFTVCKTT